MLRGFFLVAVTSVLTQSTAKCLLAGIVVFFAREERAILGQFRLHLLFLQTRAAVFFPLCE